MTDGEKAVVIYQQVMANPFSGLAFMGEMVGIAQRVQNLKTQVNNTTYAYVKSCTQPRAEKFYATSEMQELVKRGEAVEKLRN